MQFGCLSLNLLTSPVTLEVNMFLSGAIIDMFKQEIVLSWIFCERGESLITCVRLEGALPQLNSCLFHAGDCFAWHGWDLW